MKVTLESTEKIVTLVIAGKDVPARVWEGETAAGVKCHAFITRIAVHELAEAGEFERDLHRHVAPSPALAAIPLRMIL